MNSKKLIILLILSLLVEECNILKISFRGLSFQPHYIASANTSYFNKTRIDDNSRWNSTWTSIGHWKFWR